jgi:hypothetical protein
VGAADALPAAAHGHDHAVETRPGTDPDRASFTTALHAARDQLTAAAGIWPDDPGKPADLLGVIGRAVLATLLPARRPRYSARKVKCATSRYLNRDDGRPAAATAVAAIDILVHTPPLDTSPRPRRRHRPGPSRPRAPRPPTRRDRVTALLVSNPRRAWSGTELAEQLQIPKRNMLTQLAEWTRLGFITRVTAGSYALPPPAPASATRSPARAAPDDLEEHSTVQRPQRGEDERPCTATNLVHPPGAPGSDTPIPAASWI